MGLVWENNIILVLFLINLFDWGIFFIWLWSFFTNQILNWFTWWKRKINFCFSLNGIAFNFILNNLNIINCVAWVIVSWLFICLIWIVKGRHFILVNSILWFCQRNNPIWVWFFNICSIKGIFILFIYDIRITIACFVKHF